MQFDVVTLFPEMVDTISRMGVVGRAVSDGLIGVRCWNPRDYTQDLHRTVDDRPYGGGPGMVLKVEPLRAAIDAAVLQAPEGSPVIYLSPQGDRLTQEMAEELAALPGLVLIAGRYEGIDQRVIDSMVDREVSVGDYVLSGGELPAMVVVDSVARLIPGVLGDTESAKRDSFSEGLLDFPHYTRPDVLDVGAVPDVLLSGDHARIERWRLKQALGRTWLRRPDLLQSIQLDAQQRMLLDEFVTEFEQNQCRDGNEGNGDD
ncbi:MAG: tRNA (guanosine(37)-N1)-methyltransferase TrmD [Pseudomonadota bacterium]|nr:tRNA (guanosine(37)-N1)-methyltransferase TrmD [Pseudomonadota bacterium]